MTAGPVAVLGGSIAGLGAALFLGRLGHEVVVLDRDPAAGTAPPLGSGDHAPRRATAQAAHSHIFLGRLRELLLERAPDVLEAMLRHGVRELPMRDNVPATLQERTGFAQLDGGHPVLADPALVALASRRATIEEALRSVVLGEANVTVRAGVAAGGLRVDGAAVTGVVLEDGTTIDASLVVDASGRRTPVPAWLADVGIVVDVDASECGISYLSRFYRARAGRADPVLTRGFNTGGSFDGWSALVFPGDDGTFSVTFGILPEDRQLRGLLHADAFDAAAAAIPVIAEWTDPDRARAIGTVAPMNGLKNRIRRYVHDGAPIVTGLVAVGDAAATSNPAHSRGCTLAIVHAAAIADAVHAAADGHDLALAADAVLDATLRPWVADSVEQDAVRLARWRPDAPPAPTPRPDRLANGELYGAAQFEPELWRRFSRMQHLVDLPDATLGDPAIVARVRAMPRRGVPAVVAPSRAELVDLVDAHAAPVGRRVAVAT